MNKRQKFEKFFEFFYNIYIVFVDNTILKAYNDESKNDLEVFRWKRKT